MNSLKENLLFLGDEEMCVGFSKRESLFPHILKSLFDEQSEKESIKDCINELIMKCAIDEISFLHLIEKCNRDNTYPLFIKENLDRWYIALNYLTARNRFLIEILESNISPKLISISKERVDQLIKEQLIQNYYEDNS
jgi:hypothetical protein